MKKGLALLVVLSPFIVAVCFYGAEAFYAFGLMFATGFWLLSICWGLIYLHTYWGE